MLIALTAAIVYFAQGAPDTAQPPAATQAPTPAEAAAAPNGKTVSPLTVSPQAKPKPQVSKNTVVCHEEPVLGSHFPKKICATVAQFDERRAQDQEQLREWVALRPYKAN